MRCVYGLRARSVVVCASPLVKQEVQRIEFQSATTAVYLAASVRQHGSAQRVDGVAFWTAGEHRGSLSRISRIWFRILLSPESGSVRGQRKTWPEWLSRDPSVAPYPDRSFADLHEIS